jgi:hypothetical protein
MKQIYGGHGAIKLNAKGKTYTDVKDDKHYCKTTLFPPLYVSGGQHHVKTDTKVFNYAIMTRTGKLRGDLRQIETIRWLQRHSIRFRTKDYDYIDEDYQWQCEGIEDDWEYGQLENKLLCFTERIPLAERDDILSRRYKPRYKEKDLNYGIHISNCTCYVSDRYKPSYKERVFLRDINHGINNSCCTCHVSESESKKQIQTPSIYTVFPKVQNSRCFLRHSKTNLFENTSGNANTFLNGCSIPRNVECNLEITGNGYDQQTKYSHNITNGGSIHNLPKIMFKRNAETFSRQTVPSKKTVKLYILGKEQERALSIDI